MKHVASTLSGQHADVFHIKAGSTYRYHHALHGEGKVQVFQ
jgi:hypothetical protein